MVFPVVMYGCESWTIKKGECWSINAFKLWCWRRLLRVPWKERRSNQSILKEINLNTPRKNPCWSWTPILRPPDMNSWLIRKDSATRKDWKQKEKDEKDEERMRWLYGITNSLDMNLGNLWEMVRDREAWHATFHGFTKIWIRLGTWATTAVTTTTIAKCNVS